MAQLHTYEVNCPSLTDRLSIISNMISENFRAPWNATPIGSDRPIASEKPARFNWACADGVDYSHCDMPALHLINRGSGRMLAPKFYCFSADQMMLLKMPGRPNLHLQPEEMLILASDMPCELIMPHEYRTTAFIIDGEMFRTYVPDVWSYVARPLRLKCRLEGVLRSTMDSAWDLSNAGIFDAAGPKLVRSFLEVLALLPIPEEQRDIRSRNAQEIRRTQAKAFIDKNFAFPGVTVASVAEHLRVSQRYLQMAFRDDGVTPLNYLRKRRLSASANLLRDPKLQRRSITEICFTCGFSSSAHFSTEFRREYGVSPRDYRAKRLSELTA